MQRMDRSFFFWIRQRTLGIWALLSFLLSPVAVAAPAVSEDMEYLCAWVALASYSDRVGEVARAELAANDFVMLPLREEDKRTSASYYLLRREEGEGALYLLSVTGTKDWKDVKIDLSLHKVPFAGETPTEFQEEAERKDVKSGEPLVHSGFNAYTQTAFFTPQVGVATMGEQLRDVLCADPKARICLTGHSLGGAVAVLFAARLMDMGVPKEQIAVVTFGAPAVGNRAFAEKCEGLAVRRVVMAGDPVGAAVQAIDSAYTQFGEVTRFRSARGQHRFSHAMVNYVDALLRRKFGAAEESADGAAEVGAFPKVYAASTFSLPDDFAADRPLWQRAVASLTVRRLPGVVHGEAATVGEALEKARALGCAYVLWQSYEMQREREKEAAYQVMLQEGLFDGDGRLLFGQGLTTSTSSMTPLLAALYDTAEGREGVEAALLAAEAGK
ncbi:MAG: lipase family protein [Schwartzia sp. (in: firmicutes)]